MRLFLVLGLTLSALSFQLETRGAAPTEDQISEMCSSLNKEYGGNFFVDSSELDKVKLKSESGNRIVWWNAKPKKVFENNGLDLLQVRFDNFGGGDSVFHLSVEKQDYKLHLSGDEAKLRAAGDSPEAHINLIKAWVETFRGQVIKKFLVARTAE